jgi:hypothetical protein
MICSKRSIILALIVCFMYTPHLVFSQIGNTNGQYDDVIKQAYSLLQLLKESKKKELKEQFIENNFQSKKEFKSMLSSSNIMWSKDLLTSEGIPDKNDIIISGWKTVSKDLQSSSFSVNITFYFKGTNLKYANSDNHICFNFYKNSEGSYIFNGIMFFKKSDYKNVKKINDRAK